MLAAAFFSYHFRRFIACGFLLLSLQLLSAQTTYHVNASSGSDANNGLSWATAFASFQAALDVAVAGDQINLTEGWYFPTKDRNGLVPTDPREATFYIDKELDIQGSYSATNPGTGIQDVFLHPTIFSGDIGASQVVTDNVFTVLHHQDAGNGSVRHVFIRDGYADGIGQIRSRGGGWYCEVPGGGTAGTVVQECRFEFNYAEDGGAVCLDASNGFMDITMYGTLLDNNQAANNGGALYFAGDGGFMGATFYNNLFTSNISFGKGGAIGYDDSNSGFPEFAYCTFAQNSATNGGGTLGIHFWDSGMELPFFVNCISWDNGTTLAQTAGGLGGMRLEESLIESFSCPPGSNCFSNSVLFNEDPLFLDPLNGDFHLTGCSPAVDEGIFYSAGGNFDFDGDIRPINGLWDMGYDEYSGPSCCPAGSALFVNAVATGANTGTSWADAFTDLQDAIDFARSGLCPSITEVWIAGGAYYPSKDALGNPNPVDPRDRTFFIDFPLSLIGSFPSTGNPGLGDIDFINNPTVLSGDIGLLGLVADNVYTVVYTQNVGLLETYDYLVIGDGYADGNPTSPRGRGGGWINEATPGNLSSPGFVSTLFRDNVAEVGGGMYNDGRSAIASPYFTNCEFRTNFSATDGGAMYSIGDNGTTSPNFFNTLFWGNIATGVGAVLGYDDGTQGAPEFQHCTMFDNVAGGGGGVVGIIFWDSGQFPPLLQNSIAWNNGSTFQQTTSNTGSIEINYSLIEENSCPAGAICTGNNLFGQNPQFVDGPNGDFHLDPCSPAIDVGVDVVVNTFDFEGQSRPLGNGFDLGIDEFSGGSCCPVGSVVYVNVNASGNNNGTTWADAFNDLQDALDFVMGGSCPGVNEVWVATGTYFPTTDINDSATPADPRTKVFHYSGPSKVYGGFAGTETMLSQRNPTANLTILSGDLLGGDASDNAYTVIQFTGGQTDYLLDGFTITGGNADGLSTDASGLGGGILIGLVNANNFSKPEIRNCNISLNSANFGGGVCVLGDGNFQVTGFFENCYIGFNTATFSGAGVFNNVGDGSASSIFEKCVFDNNIATGFGGAIHFTGGTGSASGRAENTLFIYNQAGLGGSVMSYGDPVAGGFFYQHCTMADNSTTAGAAIQILDWDGSQLPLQLSETIMWNNGDNFQPFGGGIQATMSSNLLEDAACPSGVNCSDVLYNLDPEFVDPLAQDYHLNTCSPAIDAVVGSSVQTDDFEGDPRPTGSSSDIGYDEYIGVACCPASNVVYVDISATGNNSGRDWTNAFTDLQSAIDLVKGGTCGSLNEIWVAGGTYLPTKDASGNANPTDPRTKTFFFDADVAIYAGFAGTETGREQRDFLNNQTTLSGDVGLGLNSIDNAYHVVTTQDLSQQFVIDGFYIQDGRADGAGQQANGGGWYNQTALNNSSDPVIENCVFTQNYALGDGGALYNNGVGATVQPSILSTVFFLNVADGDGGAIFNERASAFMVGCAFVTNSAGNDGGAVLNNGFLEDSSPVIINSTFIDNTAVAEGGALYNNANGTGGSSSPVMTNCLFTDNRAGTWGGAIYYDSFDAMANGTAQNTTFVGNQAVTSGDAIYIQAPAGTASPHLRNNIYWNNGPNNQSIRTNSGTPIVEYSLLPEMSCPMGLTCGSGMIYNQNPQFVDPVDYNLQMSYPAIDAGTSGNSTSLDLAGNQRVQGNAIDLGPLESPFTALPVEWLYFRAQPRDKKVLLSWATATEVSSDYFQVERSADGREFAALDRVTAAGFSEELQTYEWRDESPLSGSNFYRLRQVDLDSTFSFSELQYVWLEGTSAGPTVFPNPADERLIVRSASEVIQISDSFGRLVLRISADPGGTTVVDIAALPSGMYWLSLDQNQERIRIVKN
ncbi:MAG: choice-of-anchor Q domain-containing protein [Bacteroidota bacterium]